MFTDDAKRAFLTALIGAELPMPRSVTFCDNHVSLMVGSIDHVLEWAAGLGENARTPYYWEDFTRRQTDVFGDFAGVRIGVAGSDLLPDGEREYLLARHAEKSVEVTS
jgi:hypothetical protein